jgi:hypothetical protein
MNASPVKTGTSLSGILICGADTNQLNLGYGLDCRIIVTTANDRLSGFTVQPITNLARRSGFLASPIEQSTSYPAKRALVRYRLFAVLSRDSFDPQRISEWLVFVW